LVWIKFIACLLVIFFSGRRVAKYGDIIADKTGLGGVWIGVILISLVTSLPELFTGISAVTLVDSPDLTVGDLLGANTFNLFNLAVIDTLRQNGSLFTSISRTHALTGWFSLLLVSVVAISIFVSIRIHPMSLGWVGWYTPLIILLYLLAIRRIFIREKQQPSPPESEVFAREEYSGKVYLHFGVSAAFIIGAGIWLPIIGEEIAVIYGWKQSFVGSLFLAFTTSLPEMTVSYTAARIGASDMAVANIIGSNLFNMTIVPVVDLFYVTGPLLASVSLNQIITAATLMVMTLLFIAAVHIRPGRFYRISWWNGTLIILFLVNAYFSFTLS